MYTDFKPGDIVVFRADDDWLSLAIANLTDSDVCHAAMVYSDHSIVEVGAPGIGIHDINSFDGDSVYIMRLLSEADPAPLIAAADNYMKAGVSYDFAGLFLLGGLLIFQKLNPTTRLLKIVNRILAAACLKLDEYLKKPGKASMVCSQLVYQIYEDCGSDYHIDIPEGSLYADIMVDSMLPYITLSELLEQESSADSTSLTAPDTTYGQTPLTEDDYKEFCLALGASESEDTPANDLVFDHSELLSTVSLAGHFLDKLRQFLKLIGSNQPLSSLFVTPADLVYHAVNLQKKGTLGLERVHEPQE